MATINVSIQTLKNTRHPLTISADATVLCVSNGRRENIFDQRSLSLTISYSGVQSPPFSSPPFLPHAFLASRWRRVFSMQNKTKQKRRSHERTRVNVCGWVVKRWVIQSAWWKYVYCWMSQTIYFPCYSDQASEGTNRQGPWFGFYSVRAALLFPFLFLSFLLHNKKKPIESKNFQRLVHLSQWVPTASALTTLNRLIHVGKILKDDMKVSDTKIKDKDFLVAMKIKKKAKKVNELRKERKKQYVFICCSWLSVSLSLYLFPSLHLRTRVIVHCRLHLWNLPPPLLQPRLLRRPPPPPHQHPFNRPPLNPSPPLHPRYGSLLSRV